MSGRILFGSAAAAAAGYMIYEYQRQDERQRQSVIPVSFGAPLQQDQQQQQRQQHQYQDRPESINWVADKAEVSKNRASEIAESFQKEATEQKEQVKNEAATGWGRVKSGLSEDIGSIKDALFGRPVQSQHQKGETGVSHSIFNWSFNDAERAKAIAIGEFDRAKKDLASAQERWSQTKKGVFDSGDAYLKQNVDALKRALDQKKQTMDEASERYASYAKHNFNELSDGLDAQDEKIRREGGFFKWLTRSPPEHKKEEESVDPKDEWATSTLAGFGENAYFFSQEQIHDQLRNNEIGPSEAQRRLDELKRIKQKGWMQYAKNPESEESIAKNAFKSLEGWGETAAQFAQEELEEARRRFHRRIGSRDDAAKAMDEAAARVQEAKNRVDNTGSSWWQTAKQQTDEEHENAKRAFDRAVTDYEETKKIFDNWRDKHTGKFWSSADGSVRAMRRKELLPEDSNLQEQLLEE
ncbi:hypothetical protein LQ764DRAFT_233260 [Zygosaccharomyces rouxii]|nr:hypothetical protein LQ764DRAFT_233260 [Zygosaccharomyces rouxii]